MIGSVLQAATEVWAWRYAGCGSSGGAAHAADQEAGGATGQRGCRCEVGAKGELQFE